LDGCPNRLGVLGGHQSGGQVQGVQEQKSKKDRGHCFLGAYPPPCTEQCMEEKKSASIEELAEAIVLIACNVPSRQIDIDFINDLAGKSIDEPIFNSCINEIIIFDYCLCSE
jgi:hypothetical protein